MYDLYECNEKDTARFILGRSGTNKIFIVGLNPSTADKENSDTTVAKVYKVSQNKNFNGFVMTNLYPLRSTDPKSLPKEVDIDLIKLNIENIIQFAKSEKNPIFWAAWGEEIMSRNYLMESLKQLSNELEKINVKWVNYGDLTKYKHPRHPSRLSYSWEFSEFDISEYFNRYTQQIIGKE